MSDVEPIKGKVIIEYDGSGVDAAKKDLSSLADIVGGGLSQGTGTANEALSSLDEQMGKSADSTAALTSSVTALAKPMQTGASAIGTVTDVLGEQQAAVENVGTALEDVQKPLEGTTTLMANAALPMEAVTKNFQAMQAPLDNANTSFVQMNETLGNAAPLMPQLASGVHAVSEEFDPKAFGLDTFNENWAVFQDAMANPYPFSTIQQHLTETGQNWSDFSSSIGDDNAAILDQIATMPVESKKAFDAMSSGAQGAGQSFVSMAGDTETFNKQWDDMRKNVEGINSVGGVGDALYGPGVPKGIGEEGGGGFNFGNLVQGFDSFMRPIMYAQMAGMMIGQLGQGIYDMAALAEGPAAHSVGSFTGAVDQLGQHAQTTGAQLSESFGQGVQPMIDAMNYVSDTSNSGGTSNFFSAIVGGVGTTLSVLGSAVQYIGGGLVGGLAKILTLNPGNTAGNDWMQQGASGLQNTWAQLTGQPEPFPTLGAGMSQAEQIQASLNTTITTMYAQANDPQYLAAQAYANSQMGYAQLGQTRYDVSHTSGMSPFDYTPQAYQNSVMGAALANGGSGYGLSGVDLNRAFFGPAAQQAAIEAQATINSAGCFPAGTPVLLADGTEKAIETLRIGDQVLAHDGSKQVTTTILALIKPPPRRVYRLAFSDGNTLTLTDSHPVSTAQGWKSLTPDATRRENPDLAVTALRIGDRIHTIDGTCTLLAIEPREIVQVYNITVDAPHSFYAAGVLVHNKSLGSQVMTNVANTTVPDMDMKNSNLIQSMMGNFSSTDLSHTFTATVNWAASGDLAHTFQGAASWVGQGLTNTFNAVTGWIASGLTNTFNGVASWVASGGLQHTFEGIVDWFASGGLQHTFEGVADWVASGGLQHTFEGVADWIGQNLEHTFQGVASWVASGLSQTANVPGFAAGVQGFSGGLAVVGEFGPELVHLPQGTSVYPQSATGGFSGLDMGNSGNSGMLNLTINHTTTLDGKVVAQETIPYVAPIVRSMFGVRR